MHPAIKRTAESLLVGSGLPWLKRRWSRDRPLVLAYHNVVPDDEPAAGERTLHLRRRAFAEQLDLLAEVYDVQPLDRLFEAGGFSRPRAAITFDDAYQGAVTAGVEELAARGLPATIFVAPAFVSGGTFWWDDLADPALGAPPPELRRRALAELRGDDAAVREAAATPGHPSSMPASCRCASEHELSVAAAAPGIRLASHTWSHLNLTRLTDEELTRELDRPFDWLRERFPGALPWLSYPYGLSTPAIARQARERGYEGALRIEGGLCPAAPPPDRRHLLPRVNVPAGISRRGFELAVAGLRR